MVEGVEGHLTFDFPHVMQEPASYGVAESGVFASKDDEGMPQFVDSAGHAVELAMLRCSPAQGQKAQHFASVIPGDFH